MGLMTLDLRDQQGKDRLRNNWPANTRAWAGDGKEWWLRAQPKDSSSAPTAPRLMAPGTNVFSTQPDGLWITFGIVRGDLTSLAEYVDCVAIEVSRSGPNLADKRSRYAAATSSLVVDLPLKWLDTQIPPQGKGAVKQARRKLLGGNLPTKGKVAIPVRHLRVLYALPDKGKASLYGKAVKAVVLEGHEYICTHGLVGSWPRISRSGLFERMAPSSHHWS